MNFYTVSYAEYKMLYDAEFPVKSVMHSQSQLIYA